MTAPYRTLWSTYRCTDVSEQVVGLAHRQLLQLERLLALLNLKDLVEDVDVGNHALVAPLRAAPLARRLPFHLLLDLLADQLAGFDSTLGDLLRSPFDGRLVGFVGCSR